jgi:hypothetical protein
VDNWNNITNSQSRVRKKSFGGTFCFSNCHKIRLDTGGLVFLVSVFGLANAGFEVIGPCFGVIRRAWACLGVLKKHYNHLCF